MRIVQTAHRPTIRPWVLGYGLVVGLWAVCAIGAMQASKKKCGNSKEQAGTSDTVHAYERTRACVE
jgi:hypothetical protein